MSNSQTNGSANAHADEAPRRILEIDDLAVHFLLERATVRAVNGVTLNLDRNSTLGIVGESGCGKSVTAHSIMRLVKSPPGKVVHGAIRYWPQDADTPVELTALDPTGSQIRHIRGSEISMIFQEPMTSLNPLHTVGRQIAESVALHQNLSRKDALDRAREMLALVRIASPEQRVREFPHQLSGGMRQRVMIALALSCNPQILIADEPTTALDVTVQAQILDLMNRLREEFESSIVLITHNLGVVSQMCDQIAVMYLGKVVEYGTAQDIFKRSKHPYTEGLLNSVPVLGRRQRQLVPIEGMVPNAADTVVGCAFADRCPAVMNRCREAEPPLRETESGHLAACWLHE